jgi:hypothetical protein
MTLERYLLLIGEDVPISEVDRFAMEVGLKLDRVIRFRVRSDVLLQEYSQVPD